MNEDERIDIRVTLRDELSRPARRVEEAIEDIGDEAEESSRKVDGLEKELKDLGDASEKTSDRNVKLKQRLKETNIEVSKGQRVLRRTKSVVRNVGREFRNQTRNVGNFFQGYFRSLTMLREMLFSDMAMMIPQIITLLSTLGAGLIALLGPMGMLASNAAAMVPAYIGLFGAITAITMGLGGIKDAVSALRDPTATAEELEEALAGLGPHAREFVRAMVPIADVFEDIKSQTQEALLDGMAKHVTTLSRVYLPELAEGLRNTAQELENTGAYIVRAFQGDREVLAFQNVMSDMGDNTRWGSRALVELGRMILYIAEAAGPQLTRFLEFVTEKFAGWADSMGSDQEGMLDFFERAGDTAAGFAAGVGNIFTGLSNLSKAAQPLRDAFGDSFTDSFERFAEWSVDEDGSIKQWFTDMVPNIEAMGNVFGSLWEALGELGTSPQFATFMNDLADSGIPLLTELLTALDEGITPALVELSEAFQTAMGDNPTLIVDPLIDVLQAVADIATVLAPIFADMSPEMKSFITYMIGLSAIGLKFGFVFTGIGTAVGWVLGLFKKGDGGISKFGNAWLWLRIQIARVGSIVRTLGSFLISGFGSAIRFVIGLLGRIGPLFGRIAVLVGRLFSWISRLSTVFRILRVAMMVLSGPIGIIIAIVGLLAAAFIWAWNNVDWFREGVTNAWNWIVDKLTTGWNWIYDNVIEPFVLGIQNLDTVFETATGLISAAWDWVGEKLSDGWEWINDKVFGAFGRGLSWIGDQVQAARDRIGELWDGVKSFFAAPINWVIRNVWNDGIKRVFQAVVDVIPGLNVTIPNVSEISSPSSRSGGAGRGGSGGRQYVQARATGGYTPPGWTLVGEEGPELVNFTQPSRVYTAEDTLGMFHGAARPMEDPDGGFWSDRWADIKTGVQWVADGVRDAAGNVVNFIRGGLANAAGLVLDPIGNALPGPGDGKFPEMLGGTARQSITWIKDWLRGEDDKAVAEDTAKGVGGPRVGGKGNLHGARTWVAAAARSIARAVGAPGMRMDAFNRSMAGDHPQGTAVDFLGAHGILNRVANYANANFNRLGIRYIAWQNQISRGGGWGPQGRGYGNDPQHRWHVHISFNRPMTGLGASGMGKTAASVFDNGGWLMPGQLALNLSKKPEPILNDAQWAMFNKIAASMPTYAGGSTVGGGGGDNYNINIKIDKVTSDVDVEKAVVGAIRKIERDRKERR